jgi:hypothetical protein
MPDTAPAELDHDRIARQVVGHLPDQLHLTAGCANRLGDSDAPAGGEDPFAGAHRDGAPDDDDHRRNLPARTARGC